MARVLGIGGVFFKTQDGEALGGWYARVLGLDVQAWGGVVFPQPVAGYQVWSPFAADSAHFAPSSASFMINLVVDDLDGVLEQARREGVEPVGRDDADPNGRFAWLMDPAGQKVELWQPAADTPSP